MKQEQNYGGSDEEARAARHQYESEIVAIYVGGRVVWVKESKSGDTPAA
ncbi:MAG: hypothetical protein WBV94_24790 [Blastocatellia bacterium]